MNKYQEALEIIKNRNYAIKLNHRIGSRDIANEELKEISAAIDYSLELLQEAVEKAKKYDEKETPPITGNTSDGYHTFNELYEHRTALFAVICNMFPKLSFKSWKHDDGTMFDGMFIAGIKTPKGYYSYHCEKEYFWMFANTPEIEKAPKWDGHKPKDYTRLFELLDWSEENSRGGRMNKYQEALERVRLDLEDRIETDNILMVGRMDIVTLSEACKKAKKYDEKETAMKPNNFDKEYFMYNCPNCSKVNATFKFSYCPHCGQKLDWSE